jgi:hypothetical protein
VLTMLSRRLRALLLAAVAVAGVAACSGADDAPDPARMLRSDYQRYATAVALKDGDAAAALVTDATLRYYSGLRDLALTADRATLSRQRIVDQLAVLSMRANVPAAVLRGGASRDVLAAAVVHDVISGGGAGTTELSAVSVKGDAATADLGVAGGSQVVRLTFRRDEGTWKVDLTALLAPAEAGLKSALTREKLTTRAMLTQVMTQRVGAAKAATLWEPLGR